MEKILVIGACGQIGSELTTELRNIYGTEQVIGSDIKSPEDEDAEGPFERIDVLDNSALYEVVKKYKISHIYHLAAVLSAKAESKPLPSWELNVRSLLNILEMGREKIISGIYWPSSIGAFGPSTPRIDTGQNTIMDPNTVYGISKLAGERWCEYYFNHYDVDVRSLRYPGLISYKTPPGGGTTDFAVDIYIHAAENKPYECFLKADSSLPMMYMDDAVNATIQLMQADPDNVNIRSSYNLSAFSASPKDFMESIQTFIPDFKTSFHPDYRQRIADSWPESIDDSTARDDWGWQHHFDLDRVTKVMLKNLMQPANVNGLR